MNAPHVNVRDLEPQLLAHQADEDFVLTDGQADLWLMRSPGAHTAHLLDRSELDDSERARADAFLRPADGLLYATVHVALRRLLARYLRTTPRDVRFTRETCPGCGAGHGRPALDLAPLPLHFSVSHSSAVALVGVAGVPIGVDVERLPRPSTIDVCARFLHPDEQAELAAAQSPSERAEDFGRIWTRKEAFLKGIGTGLSRSAAEDYLGADAARHPAGWSVLDIPCGATHAAALAVHRAELLSADVRWLAEEWLRSATAPDPQAAAAALAC
ncbi:4'-phosphopantetheinyl transferase superfamily protein [Streptomyces sp. NPDC019224]|uniref:4'-phosphopantetheinyl transferase family protein n=1 Tax=Streptomyces sp. NPDC019224 TaxID=3154484 RepID=UPI0033E764CA